MQGLPTFLCVDVMKRPQVEADVERYRRHLRGVRLQRLTFDR